MIFEAPQMLGLSHILFIIKKLFLSSNESLLLFLFDTDSTDIATQILCEPLLLHQSIIVINIDPSITTSINTGMYYENAIILSVISQQPSMASQFFINAYLNKELNSKSKHLCIFNDKLSVQRSEIESFVRDLHKQRLYLALLQWTNDGDILIYPPSIDHNNLPTKAKTFNINSSNVQDLFSLKHRNISVVYIAFRLIPPFTYHVQDFTSSETYMGGIDIRIFELLIEKWNWTVQFLKFKPLIQDGPAVNLFEKIYDHPYRTILPEKRRHPYSYFYLQDIENENKYI